mmetsp:Transcript_16034/g.45501  ORF Transcript_16034/g.45501 Transcript_16034/m.45501 type:complete len:277 (+) Transcript_16034:223-1053(+)
MFEREDPPVGDHDGHGANRQRLEQPRRVQHVAPRREHEARARHHRDGRVRRRPLAPERVESRLEVVVPLAAGAAVRHVLGRVTRRRERVVLSRERGRQGRADRVRRRPEDRREDRPRGAVAGTRVRRRPGGLLVEARMERRGPGDVGTGHEMRRRGPHEGLHDAGAPYLVHVHAVQRLRRGGHHDADRRGEVKNDQGRVGRPQAGRGRQQRVGGVLRSVRGRPRPEYVRRPLARVLERVGHVFRRERRGHHELSREGPGVARRSVARNPARGAHQA